MRSTVLVVAILMFPMISLSKTIHVPGNFGTIQQAIDAASNGDTVLVSPGSYVENIDFKGKAILVTSEYGPDVTTIDGNLDGSVVVFVTSEGPDSVLDGFTLTNGGGGIYSDGASPTIKNNIISKHIGRGVSCTGISSPVIENNIITENYITSSGSGIRCYGDCTAKIIGNFIFENIAADGYTIESGGASCLISNNSICDNHGGGIYDGNNAIITHNLISGNIGKIAGGLWCHHNVTVENNIIIDNYSRGIYVDTVGNTGLALITNNIISGNIGKDNGGIGCLLEWSPSTVIISNNIIYNNTSIGGFGGGGVGVLGYASLVTIINNTVFNNKADKGGGIFCNSSQNDPKIINSIIWNNHAQQSPEIHGDPDVSYCNVKGCWPGTGNIDADPLFVDPYNGDFHLTYSSPCKDEGTWWSTLPLNDFEGDPRKAYGGVDMGADEFYTHLYWTGDGTPGGNVEIKFVGLPGTSPVGLCIGSGVLDPPLKSMWGDWYLAFPIVGPIVMQPIPYPDGVLILLATIPGTPPAPYAIPMQALIGSELTNLCTLHVD